MLGDTRSIQYLHEAELFPFANCIDTGRWYPTSNTVKHDHYRPFLACSIYPDAISVNNAEQAFLKAFISNYMQGLRHKVAIMGLPIVVTYIKPGLVDTAVAKGEGLFWVQSPKKAARQINELIKAKRRHGYVTKRWRLVAWILKFMPDFLYHII